MTITAQDIVAAILILLVLAALTLARVLYGRVVTMTKRAKKFTDLMHPVRHGAATSSHQGVESDALIDAFTVLESTLSNAMKVISESETRLATAAAAQVSMADQRPLGDVDALKTMSLKSLADSSSAVDSLSGSAEGAVRVPDTQHFSSHIQGHPTVTSCRPPGEPKSASIYDISTGLRIESGPPSSIGQPNTDADPHSAEHENAEGRAQPCPPGGDSLISTSETKSFVGDETNRNEAAVLGLLDAADKTALLLQRVDSAQAALRQLNLTISKISTEGSDSPTSEAAQARTELERDSGIRSDGLTTSTAGGVKVTRSAIGKLSQVAAKLSQLASRFSL